MRPLELGCIVCLLLLACDFVGSSGALLEIVDPAPNAVFTSRDDMDPNKPGTQIEVTVAAPKVASGAIVELYRVNSGQLEKASIVTTSPANGLALFPSFTLQPGQNQLSAHLLGSRHTSEPLFVTLRESCGELAFVEPSGESSTPIRLGLSDDLDGEPCAATFTTRVIAGTGLPDGTEVTLLVNSSENRSTKTSGGVAKFEDVQLGNRDDTPNLLSLRVTNSTCPTVDLAAPVFVSCEGPSCSITGPERSDLNADDDQEPLGAGLQVDFEVQTDSTAVLVQLLINGDIDHARSAAARDGQVVFKAVPLPEGKGVRVKAICTSERGASRVFERLFNVDTTACALAITTPLANTQLVAAQESDEQPPAQTLDMAVAAHVGSDCVSVRVGALQTADCAGIEKASELPLAAGQSTLNSALTLTLQGPQYVCVQANDAAGNAAYANVPIHFDKQAPNLTIIEPGGALLVNREGTAGRQTDQDTQTSACEQPILVSCDVPGETVQVLTAQQAMLLASSVCLNGEARFVDVPLPTRNDGTAYEISARAADSNGLVGRSTTREISADCEAQVLSFPELTCGTTTYGTADDQDLNTAGIQHDVKVENLPAPGPPVTLTIAGKPYPNQGKVAEGSTLFGPVTFADNPTVLQACTTDNAANLSCTEACPIQVSDP